MKVLLVTTSYPDANAGEAAAGNFVVDFARCLIKSRTPTTVVAPAAADRNTVEDGVKVWRFRVPRLPLSLLNPGRLTHWPAIAKTLIAGGRAVDRATAETRPDHILALWVLPSGWWAMRAAARQHIAFSTWALGSDIWTLGKIPLVKTFLSQVLRRARARFADGLQLGRDVEALCRRPCGFLPPTAALPAGLPGPLASQQGNGLVAAGVGGIERRRLGAHRRGADLRGRPAGRPCAQGGR